MPYIKEHRRLKLWPFDDTGPDIPDTPGELNFVLTQLCIDYASSKGINYTVYNEIVGALECAKNEFYRRVIAPYEDGKKKENGDVYFDEKDKSSETE